MIFEESFLSGSYSIDLEPFRDERGWFARTFCKEEFKAIGHDKEWVQINHSFTERAGTVRGMHYQKPPFREIKLVRCIAGRIHDVIVDLRKDSPTFLRYFGLDLSAANKKMIYIPEGFAHGFQTLTDHCELIYHHTSLYAPEAEAGVNFNEPAVAINWPLAVTEISARDKTHPFLESNFKGL